MYCKNCGKKLPEDARFCDRCNMSVRKKEDKMDIIEELKEERLARKKANAIEARLKSIKKVKRKRYVPIMTVIISIVAAGALSFGIGYFVTTKNSSVQTEATPVPTASPTPKSEVKAEPEINDDGYVTEMVANANFAYPAGFEKDTSNQTYHLHLKDKSGDGEIIVNKEITGLTANELIVKYRDSIKNAKAQDSLANGLGYTVTLTADGKVYHKRSFVQDGWEMYYEFRYPEASEKTAEYDEAIKYMDEYFTVS